MFLFRRPAIASIRRLLDSQSKQEFSYRAVGATAAEPPAGYVVDHTRIQLGHGLPVFIAAQAALKGWQQFQLGWVEPCWPEAPIRRGEVVGVLAHVFGLWSLNACRIAYVVDEQGPPSRFGFAYGTLPEHVESGEERFTIEWHQEDNSVWYDILAFSRPNQLAVRLGYPLVRRLQRRFARDSAQAMKRFVAAHATPRDSSASGAIGTVQ